MALNDPSEYSGGSLCFFVNDQLFELDRPMTSYTQHPAKVLHGVRSLFSGSRKSLFVVNKENGLGEGAVVQATDADVDAFEVWKMRSEVRPAKK